MSKKIRVTLPQNIYEIIKNDIDDFNMTSNHFMNYIFLNLNDKYKNLSYEDCIDFIKGLDFSNYSIDIIKKD